MKETYIPGGRYWEPQPTEEDEERMAKEWEEKIKNGTAEEFPELPFL